MLDYLLKTTRTVNLVSDRAPAAVHGEVPWEVLGGNYMGNYGRIV
jgi:hypothetical protein